MFKTRDNIIVIKGNNKGMLGQLQNVYQPADHRRLYTIKLGGVGMGSFGLFYKEELQENIVLDTPENRELYLPKELRNERN
jgi:hypothetical protein